MQGRPAPFLLSALILGAVYLVIGAQPIWDIDIFWHIKAGEWIAANKSLPETDIFSCVDPQRPWHTFQWLYEVLVYGLDKWGGLTAVRVAHAFVIVVALLIFFHIFWRNRTPVHALAVFALLAVVFADRVRTRPDAFNLLFLGMLFPSLVAPRQHFRHFAGLALLAFAWANVHAGGALLLPVLLAARAVGRLAQDAANPAEGRSPAVALARDLGVLAAISGVMLIQPGFLRGTIQSFTMLTPSERFIPEWMTTYEFLFNHAREPHEFVAGLLPLAGLAALLGYTFWRSARNRWSFSSFPFVDLALSMPMVFLSLEHVRFLWLGIMPWLLLIRRWDRLPLRPAPKLASIAGAAAAALLLLGLDLHYHVYARNVGPAAVIQGLADDLEPGEFPEGAAEFMSRAGLKGRILNHAPWGGFLLYRCWPDCTVMTDGRGNFTDIETFILVAIQMAGVRRDAINATWKKAHFDIVVHPSPFPIMDYSRFDWVLVYRDKSAWVYLRNEFGNAANFDSVRRAYAAMGLRLPMTVRTTDVYVWERRVSRFWASQRLSTGTERERFQKLKTALAADPISPGPRMALAALYHDVGLYAEARDTAGKLLGSTNPKNARASLLTAMAFVADGFAADAFAICLAMRAAMQTTPGYARQLTADQAALFQLIYAHLTEYMLTVPYNVYKYKADGVRWKDWPR